MDLEDLRNEVAAAIAANEEGPLRRAWEHARALGGREAWRQGARCLTALRVDRFQLTWSTFMHGDAEVHVAPHALEGPAAPDPDAAAGAAWQESVGRSVEYFVKLGYLDKCADGLVDLGPTPPPLPPLPDCLECLDEAMCRACEGSCTRLNDDGCGPCAHCDGTGACPRCGRSSTESDASSDG